MLGGKVLKIEGLELDDGKNDDWVGNIEQAYIEMGSGSWILTLTK